MLTLTFDNEVGPRRRIIHIYFGYARTFYTNNQPIKEKDCHYYYVDDIANAYQLRKKLKLKGAL